MSNNRRALLTAAERVYIETREKVREGLHVHCWPEFLTLIAKLGVELPKSYNNVSLQFGFPSSSCESLVTVVIDDVTYVTKHVSSEAFWWLESLALFRRLGVDIGLYTCELELEFGVAMVPVIRQSYIAAQPKANAS